MKKVLSWILIGIMAILISFIFIPKFLIIDKTLMKNKVFILSDNISEGIFSVSLKKADIYYQDKQVVKKSDIDLYIYPLTQSLVFICQSKKSEFLHKTFGGFEIKFDDFRCLPDFESISGNIRIKDGIFGKLKLKNFIVQGRNIDYLEFDFKGKTFEFKGSSQGINLSGNGVVSYDNKNPLNSKINGNASIVGFNLTISGTITDLKFNTQ